MATEDRLTGPRYSVLFRWIAFGLIFIVTATAATLIPLFATGTIALGKPSQVSSRIRLTYDPVYYGNLHPYLYPNEREKYQVTTDYDVIIVGAGIAGLSAAWVLRQQSNLTVLVLEARDTPGGRILSVPFGQGSVELGAQWLVGGPSNPLNSMSTLYDALRATSLPAPLQLYGGDQVPIASGSQGVPLQPSSIIDFALPILPQSANTAFNTANSYYNSQNQDFFTSWSTQIRAPLFNLTNTSIGIVGSMDGTNSLSLGHLSSIPNGLVAYINSSDKASVMLNTVVTSIKIEPLNGTVTIANGTKFTSQYIICTLPLGVLTQPSVVEFSPPLPQATLQALSGLSAITLNPVHLRFNNTFWDPTAELLVLNSSPTGWANFLSLYTFTGEPILVALPGPDASAAMETLSDQQTLTLALDALKSVYGDAVPSSPVSYMITRWGLNPYARGTHSTLTSWGTPGDRATLAEPVGNTLMFAGEATHPTHPSSLHGAHWSGVNQALRIIAATQFPGNGTLNTSATCLNECYGKQLVVPTPMASQTG